MKRSILSLLIAAGVFAGSAFADEKAAVETFKKDVAELKVWSEAQDKVIQENPMMGFAMIGELATKVKNIKSAELPADLKETWAALVAGVDKMNALIAPFPKKPEDLQGFITKKMTEEPAFMENFGKKMEEIGAEMKPVTEKMKELGKKYNIEGLEKLGPKE